MNSRLILSGLSLLVSALAIGACSAASDDPGAGAGGGGAGGVIAGGGAGGAFGGGGVPPPIGGGQNMGGGFGAVGNVGDGGDGMNCGGEKYVGEQADLDIFIMMDRSSSMIGIAGVDVWAPITQAILNFVNLPAAAGIGVGIGFFPPLEFATDPTAECNVGIYAMPDAPMALLPGNAQAIQAAITANFPFNGLNPPLVLGFTPTVPAMQGARDFARGWAAANPTHRVVVVLVTDGAPNNCNSDINGVATVATELFTGMPSIPTYVIGIGDVNGLNTIAQSGGTNQALIVPADPNMATQQFAQAMDSIRGRALPCDYAVPDDPNADVNNVNLDFTPPGSTTAERIGYVPDANACTGEGWYFQLDEGGKPSRVVACPATCDRFKQNIGGQVQVVLGCPRIDIK